MGERSWLCTKRSTKISFDLSRLGLTKTERCKMVNVQRLVRDRHLTPEEADRYRAMRELAEHEKGEMAAYLKASPPGFRSWEELAEFRGLVKSLRAAREAKELSREEAALIAGLQPEWI